MSLAPTAAGPDPDPPPDAEVQGLRAIALGAAAIAATGGNGAVFGQWRDLLDLVALRRGLPADTPPVTVIAGPTGAGKSTLFNLVLGRIVSPAGVLRPLTTHPVAAASRTAADALAGDPFLSAARAGLGWVTDADLTAPLAGTVLIDTPDFDSVAAGHRERSERLLLRADRVILVLSEEKYGDAAVERTLDHLLELGNLAGVVFNKQESRAAFDDCATLLARRGAPPPIAIPRLPRDGDTIHCDAALAGQLAGLLVPRAPSPDLTADLLARLRRSASAAERALRARAITPWVASLHASIGRLREGLDRINTELPRRIADRLPLQLDEALRRGFGDHFRAQVRRFDPLREPRRWLRESISWIAGGGRRRRGAGGGGGSTGAATSELARTAAWLTAMEEGRYHDLLLDVTSDTRALAAVASQLVTPPFPWSPAAPADPSAGAAQDELRAIFELLCAEVAREVERIAKGLGVTGKVTFFGSQAAVHTVLLLVFFKTGGLSPTELIAQGLLSPVFAWLAEHLVSSGELAAVEQRLRVFFHEHVHARMGQRIEPLAREVARVETAAGDAAAWTAATAAWDVAEERP